MTGKIPPRPEFRPRRLAQAARPLGASLVSLTALMWASGAFADSTISSDRTTPVNTSNVNNGQPDNVIVGTNVTLHPPSGAAITIDSNNSATNNGTIKFTDVNGAIGILGLGGHTGDITNNGAITITESATPADTNGDGVPDGPFATGANRFGIQVTGPLAFTGTISNSATGVIQVQGNDSAGIAIDTALVGDLSSSGTVGVVGDRTFGIRTQALSGNIAIGGAVAATGQNAQGVVIGGDVGGNVLFNGTVSATGYRAPTRPTDPNAIAKLIASDLLQGGPAISVAGNIGDGLIVDTTGVVVAESAAPALQIGAVSRDIDIGAISSANAFGIELRGNVTGAGTYDKVTATGLQIGVAGGGAVNTAGGLHNLGSITATSFVADATAAQINSGANIALFQQDGTVSVAISNASGNTGRAIQIGAGANVPALANSDIISSVVSGTSGTAIAIQDLSGTLNSIQNTRTIAASLTSVSGPPAIGQAIAIDVRANTSGVSLLQFDASGGTALPSITGDILFGSGNDTAEIQAGTVTGALAFGGGANSLHITGGSTVTGALTAAGGTLALNLENGALKITGVDHVNLTSLNLASAGALTFTADPVHTTSTELDVAGPATLASGSKIGLRFNSLLTGTQTFTVIRASSLSAGTIDTSLLGQIPFLYTASLQVDQPHGTVAIAVAEKTPSQLGISSAAAQALNPVLGAVGRSPILQTAFLDQTTQSGFLAAFNQLLPSRSSALFELSAADAASVGRAIDDRQGTAGGAWVQETNYGAIDSGSDSLPGYHAWGVGLMGGYEAAFAPQAVFGLSVGASSGQVRELGQSDIGKETVALFQAGLYWRGTAGRFSADARVGGDYLRVTGDRVVDINNIPADAFQATSTAHWNGLGVNARFRAGYEGQWGSMFIRPQVGVDFDQLHEDGHDEAGGGVTDLSVSARSSSRLSGFTGVSVGAVFGDEATWGPELLVGYRGVVNENLGDTTARFVAGGDPFTLAAEKISGSGVVGHIAFKGENGYGGFAVEGGAEARGSLTIYDLRLTAHLQF